MTNPFKPFYTTLSNFTDSRPSFRVDLPQLKFLSQLCASTHQDFPSLPPNWEKMSYAEQLRLSSVNNDVLNRVSSILLRNFCENSSDSTTIGKLWENYYIQICYQVVLNICSTIENAFPYLNREEQFESMFQMSCELSSRDGSEQYGWSKNPKRFLQNFNSGISTIYEQKPLLDALNAWSYKTIRNGLCSQVRARVDRYFLLSPLGIVTNRRTSFQDIQDALEWRDFLDTINYIVQTDYPNPEEGRLRQNLNQEIQNHLAGTREEQFNRYRILVRTLKEYLKAHRPLAVNLLTASDWEEIRDFYQRRLNDFYRNRPEQSPPSITPSAIVIIIKSVGISVRNNVRRINNPISINAQLGDSDMTLENIILDQDQPLPSSLLESQSLIEQSPLLYQLIDEFCQSPPTSIHRPSNQQVLLLRYGLDLKMTEVSGFLQTRFGLSGGPGGASLRCTKARTALVRTIHQGMNSTEKVTEDAIELVIEVLKEYYSNVIHQLIQRIANQLGIDSPAVLIDPTLNDKFIDIITTNVEQMSGLNLRDNILRSEIEEIVTKFRTTDT